jgi:glutamate-1-semialdehyde aminotransferase/predicted aldo/keto reductase-like oxidoreductase
MQHRRLGRTNLYVSVVGFGTCQLRLIPESSAIDTLLKGFDLGVTLIHTAPDYEGAEEIVARAVARTSKRVIVASQGYDVHHNSDGPVRHFEHLFETTCRRFRSDRVDLYGIACVDDREAFGENVWGRHGMVEFLQKKKSQGRLGATFCTTHGNPDYIARLVRSGAFDAIMVAYNELGFHLLSYHPPAGRHFESVPRNRLDLFPLCRELDVGVLVMKPLAGGLLCRGKAFPPRFEDSERPTAGDVLRSILECQDVACVVPGTASIQEAEENARAGHARAPLPEQNRARLHERVAALQTTLCSRCGLCDVKCSQKLPVSWLFRAGYVARYPSETYETWDDVEYFHLHPGESATCSSCPTITCGCPHGVDVPRSLTQLHDEMLQLRDRGQVAGLESDRPAIGAASFRARIRTCDVPEVLVPGETAVCRLYVENVGTRSWFALENPHRAAAALSVVVGGAQVERVFLRDAVHPGQRGHFVFTVTAPPTEGAVALRLQLLGEHEGFSEETGPVLFDGVIPVRRLVAAAHPPSRTDLPGPEYAAEWVEHNLPTEWADGSPFHAYVRVVNRGSRTWRANDPDGRCVDLAVTVDGGSLQGVRVPRDVPPSAEVTLDLPLVLSGGPDPEWVVRMALVEQNVAWFHERGVEPRVVRVRKRAPTAGPTAAALAVARRSNNWGYQPTQGVPHGRDRLPYPLFVREARGARFRDPDGNEWVDYVMGWGSALLGYAHPEIRAAVGLHLDSGAVLGLPHELEMELTAALCARFEGADAALFGKNGSDVCTAAVRIARTFTGRRKVLFSGYHGWQAGFAEAADPSLAAPGAPAEAFRFRLNDLGDFCRLVEEHGKDTAGVVLEPAAQVEGTDGPVREADPAFLSAVADICRTRGIVLVFDEIMTAFRHPGGSVQTATGVVPDLTCLGKALTSGWPLSALIGRWEVLAPTVGRIYYHPTFKGEMYSFAAALAALRIHDRVDVPAAVGAFGSRLMAAVTRVGQELGVAGRMVGRPYRCVYRFADPDPERLMFKRTLLSQELMKRGVLTFRGFMLPSLAHGEEELTDTLTAFQHALDVVRCADRDGSFAQRLEIPLIR